MLHVVPDHAAVAPWTGISGILSPLSPATSPCTVPASLIYEVFILLWGTEHVSSAQPSEGAWIGVDSLAHTPS